MSRFPRRGTAFLGTGHGCFLPLYGPQGIQGPQGYTGYTGATGMQGATGTLGLGNTAVVDSVYGNNSTASVGGSPYLTVQAAVSAVSSGQTVWVLPGTYTLSSGITLTNGTSIRGLSLQTTTLQLNVTNSATMITIGENCRIEDLTLNLTCTGSTNNVVLKGIVFGGTSSQTSKLRTSVVTVRNSTMSKTLTSTVTGVEFLGTGTLSSSFSFNSLKGSTINVYSNGAGNKRGVLISNSNQASTRDLNIYVAQPPDTDSTGSYVGVETNDSINNIGSIQMRTTTVGTILPTLGNVYTASDILQTTPTIIEDSSYLASAGIQIGPGTDLVTKSAGSKGFTTYVYPTIIYYGLKGSVSSGVSSGYLWPGTLIVSAGQCPDPGLPAAYFRAQQQTIISGLSASLTVPPGGTSSVTITIYYTPTILLYNTAAVYTGYISGTTLTVVTGPSYGSIAVGQPVSGTGILINTYIVSGSGSTWIVYPSQTIGSVGSPVAIANRTVASSFTGTINNGSGGAGTILTITSSITGDIAIGQYITGTGVTDGTYIVSGSNTTWVVSTSQKVNSTSLFTNGNLSTPFTVTIGPSDTLKTFYNGSTRLNVGDRIHLFISYTGSNQNNAHDVTAQIDLF